MRTKSVSAENFRLPVIAGVATENFEPGKAPDLLEIRAALDLLRLSSEQSSPLLVRSIDVSKGYCLVVTDDHRARITFRLDNLDTQLARLAQYQRQTAENHRELQTVNLIVARNTPVTFQPAPVELASVTEENMPPQPPAASPSPAPKTSARTRAATARPASTPTVRRAVAVKKKPEPKPVRRAVAVHPHAADRDR